MSAEELKIINIYLIFMCNLTLLVEGSGGVKKWRGGGQFDPPYLKALKSHSKVGK